MNWTDYQLERAKYLWNETNLTSRQIGEEIGKSRDAVCGMAHRRNWKAKPYTYEPKPRKTEKIKTTQVMPIVVDPPVIERIEPMKFRDVNSDTCAFVIGDPSRGGKATICGRHTVAGFPYCKTHKRLCYQSPKQNLNHVYFGKL